MAEDQDKDSKTEEASEKKIRDSMEKGQLPFAKEAPVLASFSAILFFALFFVNSAIQDMAEFLSIFIERPEDWPLDNAHDVLLLLRLCAIEIGKPLAILAVLLMGGAFLGSALQNMPAFVLDRIQPKFSNISISKGFTRMFGVKGFVEFGKQLGKLIFAGIILTIAMRSAQTRLLEGMIMQPVAFGAVIGEIATQVLIWITVAMIIIAVLDVVWSRFSWLQDLRMTRQEVKDEMKQTVGDPVVRGRMRSLQRDRARKRMMAAVPTATLVIANPTHFAIALRYVREENAAPIVVAKGTDLIALKIREAAESHGIPVFEDVALARSMYKQVSVDSMIPPQFYQAVAELVRAVYARRPAQAPRV